MERAETAAATRARADADVEPMWTRPLRLALRVIATRAIRSAARHTEPAFWPAAARLSSIPEIFLIGYRAGLDTSTTDELSARLTLIDTADRGFAYEGAAMSLALLDHVAPGRRQRFVTFASGAARAHVYMVYIGAGWAAARLGRSPELSRRGRDPLLGWLVIDGYGFHHGYFHPETYVVRHEAPPGVAGYAARAFDQGLGRSLWFVHGADVNRIARSIAAFPPRRRGDLWSGVALAAAYAGGVPTEDLRALKARGIGYEPEMAQGAAFAAEARERAGNAASHTALACAIFAGVGAAEAAWLVRSLAAEARDDGDVPAYEGWRRSIGAALIGRAAANARRRLW